MVAATGATGGGGGSRRQQLLNGDTFFLDTFALRQWDDPAYSGTRLSCDKAAFVARLHELFREQVGGWPRGRRAGGRRP
jgi:hypothetical protein